MTAVTLAQTDPVPNLTARWGADVETAQRILDGLVIKLRDLDKVREQLAEHGVTVDVDLGPIGNAAAAARRDLERETGKPAFSFPKPR